MSHRATHDNGPTFILPVSRRRWWRVLAPLFVAVVVGAVVVGGGSAAVHQTGPRGPRALPVNLTDVQIRQLQEQVAELKRRLLLAEEQLAGQQSGYEVEVVVPERTVAPNRVSPRRERSPAASWSPTPPPRPVVSPAAFGVQAAVPVLPAPSVSPSPSAAIPAPSPSPSPTPTKKKGPAMTWSLQAIGHSDTAEEEAEVIEDLREVMTGVQPSSAVISTVYHGSVNLLAEKGPE